MISRKYRDWGDLEIHIESIDMTIFELDYSLAHCKREGKGALEELERMLVGE